MQHICSTNIVRLIHNIIVDISATKKCDFCLATSKIPSYMISKNGQLVNKADYINQIAIVGQFLFVIDFEWIKS